MTTKLKCTWLSRHAPTPEQRASLRAYEIVQVDRHFRSGQEAWEAANEGGAPDLIVVVLPVAMQAELLRLAGDTPVIRAAMIWSRTRQGPPRWSGRWELLKQIVFEREEWTPHRVSP